MGFISGRKKVKNERPKASQVTVQFWKKFPGAGRMASLEDSVGGGDASADHLLEDDVTQEETEGLMGHDESNGGGEDPELEAIKARVQAMEEEAIKLKEVLPKRTNKPGISSTNRPPRGRGFRGRMIRGGRGGGFGAMRGPRFRGRGYYSPY